MRDAAPATQTTCWCAGPQCGIKSKSHRRDGRKMEAGRWQRQRAEGRGHVAVRADGRGQMARQAERAVPRRRASGWSVLEREAVRRGRHASPDRARSLRGTSEVTNLASSGRERASQRASGPGAPDSRCSTGDPDDLLVRRAGRGDARQGRWMRAKGRPPRCVPGQMARCLSGQMADGGARGCGGEGRLGCRCWSVKPCAGADTPRLTAREA